MARYDLPSITIEAGWNGQAQRLLDPSNPEVLVCLEGEFDASNSEKLLEDLKELVADLNVNLTLDLSRVGFFSASSVGVMVQLTEKLRRDHRRFTMVSPSLEVKRVFEACDLSSMLDTNDPAWVDENFDLSPPGTHELRRAGGSALASWVAVPKENLVAEQPAQVAQPLNPLAQTLQSEPIRATGFRSVVGRVKTKSVGRGWS